MQHAVEEVKEKLSDVAGSAESNAKAIKEDLSQTARDIKGATSGSSADRSSSSWFGSRPSGAAGGAKEVVSEHSELAKRDVKQAAGEVKQALSGDRVPAHARVRDTPDLTREAGRDRTRLEPTRGATTDMQQQPHPSISDRLRVASDVVKQHYEAAKEDVQQAGKEVAEFLSSESPLRGKQQQQQSARSEASVRARDDVVGVHSELAKRDVKQAAGEVGQALTGDRVPAHARVRDTPDLTREAPRDQTRLEPTRGATTDMQAKHPSLGDRLRVASDVVTQHARAAREDVQQAEAEVARMGKHDLQASKDELARIETKLRQMYREEPRSKKAE
jgi:phage host-nuclease inhibitor protein Gam